MKQWTKYLVIGWSIVSIGVIIVSFQILKTDYIQDDYEIMIVLKTPEKIAEFPNVELLAENIFSCRDAFGTISITKKNLLNE
jgi:hypothetical protein